VVDLAEVKIMRRTICQVAETYAHVVQCGRGEGDGDADSQDGMSDAQREDVAAPDEDQAGDQAPK